MSMNADGRFTPARNWTSKSVPPAITLAAGSACIKRMASGIEVGAS